MAPRAPASAARSNSSAIGSSAEFGDEVDIKYVWNVMDLGYRAEDILWLVEHGLLTLGYQSRAT